MTSFRLSQGGLVDRSKTISFEFDGKTYKGHPGDTLASALMANDVRVIGRSFKYHRRRGILAAGFDEPNAIVQIGTGDKTVPNLKATQVELHEGLIARSVNAWPSLSFDVLSINAALKRFIPAGFYYKTFMWPDWHWFEPSIRKAAGLGRSPDQPDTDDYDKRYAESDVLIIGGGVSGILAAELAAASGAKIMLVEAEPECGGTALIWPSKIDGLDADQWCRNRLKWLTEKPNVTILNRTVAFGYYDHDLVGLNQRLRDPSAPSGSSNLRERLWKVRAKRVVLATGAHERPMVFPNNDRPGVMLANAGASYVSRFGVAPGQNVVIATNNDSAYKSAETLLKAGIKISAFVDARSAVDQQLRSSIENAGIRLIQNACITNAIGASGVKSAEISELDQAGTPKPGTQKIFECDCILTSSGWSPAVHLFSQSGGKLQFDDTLQAFLPFRSAQNEISIGAAAGVFEPARAAKDICESVTSMIDELGYSPVNMPPPKIDPEVQADLRPLWSIDVSSLGRKGAKAWVDYQNDVTASDVKLAVQENFRSVEHVKRYTTLGMASDQGKTSNVNGIGVMSQAIGRAPGEIGTTKFRPPYNPVTIGAFAGRRVGEDLNPLRDLPSKQRQLELGAKLEDYGGWRRPAYFAPNGESERAAITKEVRATRNSLGLFDASPLGKIEVFGPDAAEFLNRMYVNNMKTLKAGRCRYGLMLDENGVVFDDGVLARIGENHYLVGTTSGHAAPVADILQEWLQCEWVDLDVATANVTTNWAVMNLNGPNARKLLQSFDSDIDFEADAFPHMHFRAGEFAGVPCRIQRVSFSGELSYEVSVPWGYGASLYDAFLEAGEPYQIQPFGIESLMAMRIEKGFLHVGSDTDGVTLPQDVGFGRIIEKKKDDFVGRRSTMRTDGAREDRRQLVGIEVLDGGPALPIGAHIVATNTTPPAHTQGWVTSSTFGPSLDRPVALALVERGQVRIGEEVEVWNFGERRKAKLARPGPYDPEGARLNV